MRILILALLALSACGKAPVASTSTVLNASTQTASPLSDAATDTTCAGLQMRAIHSTVNCIDINARSAATYAQAVSTCGGVSLTVCSMAQYQGALQVGAIAYPVSGINYWVLSAPGVNGITVTPNWNAGEIWPVTDTDKYYCCANGVQ